MLTMENQSSEKVESTTALTVHNDDSTVESYTNQIFNSIPALSEAASYLQDTTSYLTSCFTASDGILDEGIELRTMPPSRNQGSFSRDNGSSTIGWSSFFERLADANISSVHVGETSSAGSSSQVRSGSMTSTSGVQNGSSIFQGLISRARKTVLGSADDIGWLQRATNLPPVQDGTKRFNQLLERIRSGEHKLPDSLVYLLVPGLFSNHGPLYFVNTKSFFSKMGLACHIAKIHSEASVEKNAREIKEYIEEIYWGSKKRVLLFGHSKGGVDSAAALSLYWSDLKDKVAGLVLAQSPYGGSPIASDLLREGQLGDYVKLRTLTEILICKVLKGDLQALEDLTYEKRREFLNKHPLPTELPVVSFHTETGIAPGILTSLSHVAHAELPIVAPRADSQPTKLPVVMPLAAAMAACAQLLQIRYSEKSDGLVTRRDAEVPGSVVVRPDRKLDHAWMVYSPMNVDNSETDASHTCEALLTLLVEVSQKKMHEITRKNE
ncbi:uncharacterized protein LOC120272022 isoform X1 [Dioscorea cayenensis subsp. rotundata]|uniref:Uncharacterized protein LOC120272022 isoform X1 n=2 Tax=Dioscorea cayennensis subsp. rotundata TaxID=55577 RepID=A0AB40C4G9_DIOCR|nr:uncharacterized protein LOC120272022 isoform X1 [Dioscorea cayenensis subsp. rotundata]